MSIAPFVISTFQPSFPDILPSTVTLQLNEFSLEYQAEEYYFLHVYESIHDSQGIKKLQKASVGF